MKVLMIGIFCFFSFSAYCLDSYSQNLLDLKKEINEIFNTATHKPIYLITVTRTSKMGACIVPNPIIKNVDEINAILQDISANINKLCSDGHKIIAFNEMFFSQQQALDFSDRKFKTAVTHDSVMQCMKVFNENIPNSIIFCNLLYKSEESISWKDALYLYALTLFRERNMCINRDISILPKALSEYLWNKISTFMYSSNGSPSSELVKEYVRLYPCEDVFSKNDFFLDSRVKTIQSKVDNLNVKFLTNRTYCLYKGVDQFFYNKSSYYRENDISIQSGYIYNLGDGYPAFSCLLMLDDVEKIFNTISTEICLDFVCGIRKKNNWKSNRKGSHSKLHIIQSNSVDAWLSRYENYPFNIPILYSDANYCFPNFRTAFGGMTCCLQLERNKTHSIESSDKRAILYNQVYEINLSTRSSSSNGSIVDYYKIWIYKL